MKKEQFQVGMRVVAVGLCDGKDLQGQHGTIREIHRVGRLKIGVEFDSPFTEGHTLGGKLKDDSRRGRWCEPESLAPENSTRLLIEAAGAETTIKGFSSGRNVESTARCAAGDTPNAYVGALMALEKAFGVEHREAKSGERVVVVHPRAARGYTTGDILRMADMAHGINTKTGDEVHCCIDEYAVIRDPAIFQPPQRERKAVCIKAQDDSPFREGRIYTVEGDGTIHTVCGQMQTYQQEDARRIAVGKDRFLIIDEDTKEAAK